MAPWSVQLPPRMTAIGIQPRKASFRSQLWFCRAGQRKGIVIPDRESNLIASVVARSAP